MWGGGGGLLDQEECTNYRRGRECHKPNVWIGEISQLKSCSPFSTAIKVIYMYI